MKNNNRTPIILHGHFYQPPRENPLTGIIPKHPTAKPFVDWNEKILNECYATNIQARYLDGEGKVISITNNFEYISFNFGPTLLSWIKSYHEKVYDKIIEADKKSIERLGHGNAMAQGFNHTILPLDDIEDARIQIKWGISDFESRFNRKPEGMWLPEAAINPDVIDILNEEGIKFVVLSPWQCKAVENENGEIIEVNRNNVPYERPYIISGTKGKTISAFFYYPQLAEGISFGHYLRDADNLYHEFEKIKENDSPELIHTATDGEIYGHHEPFGDMALAAIIRKVEERKDFVFTNYATELEKHPATLKAILHVGEADRGTSWSCSHGVSRWYKDCGCCTGGEEGWNQKWRTPLRQALKNNAKRLDQIFHSRINQIFQNQLTPTTLLNQYGMVACQNVEMSVFLKKLISNFPEGKGHEIELACLLEGMKNKHFSFTSCGWFFNDLSGLEPIQNINYALYAINLFQKFSTESLITPFLQDLKLAKSNIEKEGTGISIAQKLLEQLPGEVEAAVFFMLNKKIAPDNFESDNYGRFRLKSFEMNDERPILNIFDTISLRSFKVDAIYETSNGNSGLKIYLTIKNNFDNNVRQYNISNADISPRIIDQAYFWIEYSLSFVNDNTLKQIANDINNYSMIYKNSPYLPMETIFIENIGTCLRALRSLFIMPNTLTWDEKKTSVVQLIEFILFKGRKNEINKVNQIFNEEVNMLSENIDKGGLCDNYMQSIIDFLNLSYGEKLSLDLRNLQNSIYPFISGNNSLYHLNSTKFK